MSKELSQHQSMKRVIYVISLKTLCYKGYLVGKRLLEFTKVFYSVFLCSSEELGRRAISTGAKVEQGFKKIPSTLLVAWQVCGKSIQSDPAVGKG